MTRMKCAVLAVIVLVLAGSVPVQAQAPLCQRRLDRSRCRRIPSLPGRIQRRKLCGPGLGNGYGKGHFGHTKNPYASERWR